MNCARRALLYLEPTVHSADAFAEELVARLDLGPQLPERTQFGRVDGAAFLAQATSSVTDHLLGPSAMCTNIRVLHGDLETPREDWSATRVGDGQVFHSELLGREIDRSLRDGRLLAIDSIDEFSPLLMRLRERLEYALDALTWINVYLTAAEAPNFEPHVDTHDTIIVQLLGRKRWEIAVCPEPDGSVKFDGARTVDLAPGDVLFMPGRTTHRVSALGELTVHLTIAFDVDAGLSYWTGVGDRLLGRSHGRLTEAQRAEAKARIRERRRGTSLPFSVTGRREDCGYVRWASRLPPRLREADGSIEVAAMDRLERFDGAWEPALRALATGRELTFGELCEAAGRPDDELLAFVADGVEAGVLLCRPPGALS